MERNPPPLQLPRGMGDQRLLLLPSDHRSLVSLQLEPVADNQPKSVMRYFWIGFRVDEMDTDPRICTGLILWHSRGVRPADKPGPMSHSLTQAAVSSGAVQSEWVLNPSRAFTEEDAPVTCASGSFFVRDQRRGPGPRCRRPFTSLAKGTRCCSRRQMGALSESHSLTTGIALATSR